MYRRAGFRSFYARLFPDRNYFAAPLRGLQVPLEGTPECGFLADLLPD
jgi:hypothetical protein